MATDFTNPMVFDTNEIRRQQESGANCPQGISYEETKTWNCVYTTYFNKDLSINDGMFKKLFSFIFYF